uniref:POTRA domain-containing protein n=2 Tax=Timema TaxID=61471 RepID=A0A7R9IBE5_9NEOP|nr:unnamed protein product [Timema bartmani]CAD7452392.1 unnamed protein product [Timema tahoe]
MGLVHAKDKTQGIVGGSGRGSQLPSRGTRDVLDEARECGDAEIQKVDLTGVAARVDKISIDGLGRTKDDFVKDQVQDVFKARNFEEVIKKAHEARRKLDNLGCFRSVGIFIDTSRGINSTRDGLEVIFHVKEQKRIVGGVNTMVGSNEGSLVVGLKLPNLAGRGEKISAQYSYGSRRTCNFDVTFSKPLRGSLSPLFTTSIFQHASEWPSSGYKMLENGLLLDLSFFSGQNIRHNLQWEGAYRDLSCLSRSSSFQVREQSGPNIKSSVRHILSLDHRDTCIFPTRGILFQLTTEFAGLGGNVGFLKNEALLQSNLQVMRDVVVQGSLQAGLLNRVTDKAVNICDNFFLGGPLSIRGFQFRGVGTHADGNALGSDAYWAAGLHLFTPLPFRPGKGGFGEFFRSHFFLNAGSIGNVNYADDFPHNVKELTQGIRSSYGFGVALRLGSMARVELNYCVPLLVQKGDLASPGIQFGIGVNFL